MQTANHAAALAGYVLAPAAPHPHPVSAMHYAFSSWTPGGWLLLAVIVVVALFVARAIIDHNS